MDSASGRESASIDLIPSESLIVRAVRLGDQFSTTASLIDRDDAFPTEEFAQLHLSGLLTALLPVSQGGQSVGMTWNDSASQRTTGVLLRIMEEVGRGNLAVGRLLEGHVNAILLIRQWARSEQLIQWSADVHAGRIFGVWNTEGVDGLQLTDPSSAGRIGLRGAKTFASGAGHVTRPVVTGRLPDRGWQMLLIPMDEVDAQVDTSWWHPIGMKASASHRVSFDGVEVRSDCLIGSPGHYYQEPWFSSGAIRFAAVQFGGARALLDATVTTLQKFGRTDDPYQRMRIGLMATAIESGRQWLRAAAESADAVQDESDHAGIGHAITHAQMTRTAIESICQDVLRLAEQSVGSRGLVQPHPIERIGRDLTIYLRQPGPDAALADVGRVWLERTP